MGDTLSDHSGGTPLEKSAADPFLPRYTLVRTPARSQGGRSGSAGPSPALPAMDEDTSPPMPPAPLLASSIPPLATSSSQLMASLRQADPSLSVGPASGAPAPGDLSPSRFRGGAYLQSRPASAPRPPLRGHGDIPLPHADRSFLAISDRKRALASSQRSREVLLDQVNKLMQRRDHLASTVRQMLLKADATPDDVALLAVDGLRDMAARIDRGECRRFSSQSSDVPADGTDDDLIGSSQLLSELRSRVQEKQARLADIQRRLREVQQSSNTAKEAASDIPATGNVHRANSPSRRTSITRGSLGSNSAPGEATLATGGPVTASPAAPARPVAAAPPIAVPSSDQLSPPPSADVAAIGMSSPVANGASNQTTPSPPDALASAGSGDDAPPKSPASAEPADAAPTWQPSSAERRPTGRPIPLPPVSPLPSSKRPRHDSSPGQPPRLDRHFHTPERPTRPAGSLAVSTPQPGGAPVPGGDLDFTTPRRSQLLSNLLAFSPIEPSQVPGPDGMSPLDNISIPLASSDLSPTRASSPRSQPPPPPVASRPASSLAKPLQPGTGSGSTSVPTSTPASARDLGPALPALAPVISPALQRRLPPTSFPGTASPLFVRPRPAPATSLQRRVGSLAAVVATASAEPASPSPMTALAAGAPSAAVAAASSSSSSSDLSPVHSQQDHRPFGDDADDGLYQHPQHPQHSRQQQQQQQQQHDHLHQALNFQTPGPATRRSRPGEPASLSAFPPSTFDTVPASLTPGHPSLLSTRHGNHHTQGTFGPEFLWDAPAPAPGTPVPSRTPGPGPVGGAPRPAATSDNPSVGMMGGHAPRGIAGTPDLRAQLSHRDRVAMTGHSIDALRTRRQVDLWPARVVLQGLTRQGRRLGSWAG
ncbi:hypothetical protein H696_00645 [Fonticula alba]|uniref:Uncharacterized protein n=1 Tax=Fonticula alba TaxID=691883 RepID=A0A058ZFD8_FONAL|nr:hypothetical protein H696_00645 [Fonticula alba]KCV73100.1 hypothetical protein H696_00645 [Fonticula alba]|eukprot:XP_009492801.1 hypothetical protein H696_00645 [Fonticula alba]